MTVNKEAWVDNSHISAQDWLQTYHQYFENNFPITWYLFVTVFAPFVGICEKFLRRGQK